MLRHGQRLGGAGLLDQIDFVIAQQPVEVGEIAAVDRDGVLREFRREAAGFSVRREGIKMRIGERIG